MFGFGDTPGELLDPHAVPNALVELVRSADRWLILISPYFNPWRHFRDALKDARRRGVEPNFLIRKDQTSKIRKRCRELGIKPMALERLHAKIYVSDTQALLTSMNLYSASRESIEFGLRIDHEDQSELYEKVYTQARKLFEHAEPVELDSSSAGTTSKAGSGAGAAAKGRSNGRKSYGRARKKRSKSKGRSKKSRKSPVSDKSADNSKNQKSSDKPLSKTQYISYARFREGESVEEIAAARELKETTVFSHLAAAIGEGWVQLEDVVCDAHREAIDEAIDKVGADAGLNKIVRTTSIRIAFGEAKCVLAARDRQG